MDFLLFLVPAFIGGVLVGAVGTYFIARNNQQWIHRALNADEELKRRVNTAISRIKFK